MNIQNALKSAYKNLYTKYNKIATETVGVDLVWMRAIPHEKSEDVIFHEYTLHDVECPKNIKGIQTNNDYQPGNFNIDYFGINYESPYEVSMDMNIWKEVFGDGTMPQQHDIVYVELFNCLFEVASSTIVYGVGSTEIGNYKVQMTKWSPRTNVRLPESVQDTIDDLTISENELFGEEISTQISDIVDDEQTNPFVNTSEETHDEYKSNDIESIETEEVDVEDNTVIRNYYDLSVMKQSIFYKTCDEIIMNQPKSQRYFSCWFQIKTKKSKTIDVDSLSVQDGQYYIDGVYNGLEDGSEVELRKGSFLYLHAVVNEVRNVNGQNRYLLTFNNSEFKAMTKKVTNWNSHLTMSVSDTHSLLLGRTENKCRFNISIISNTLMVKFGVKNKRISIADIPNDKWCALAMNLGETSDAYIYTANEDDNSLKLLNKIDMGDLSNTFKIEEFYIPQSNTLLTNIRLYKMDGIADEKTIKKDLGWNLVKNDSKTIINDSATTPNTSPFITQQR